MSAIKVPNHYMMRGNACPTEDQLRATVPSIFATAPAEHVSNRYGFVSTSAIIDVMTASGYQVVQARGGLRKGSREHGLHEVRLRMKDQKISLHETFPEIVLLNSHNATSAAILHMGMYRQICLNGLVVGNSFETAFRVSHVGDPRESVVTAAQHLMNSAPRLTETITKWSERALTDAEVTEFATRALTLRNLQDRSVMVQTITGARRTADAKNNLWNVFNRIQENITGGGIATVNNDTGRVSRTRAMRAVKPLIELNTKLWDMASEFLPS